MKKEYEFLKFKTDELADQLYSINTHPRLFGLVFSLANFVYTRFRKPIVITDVWRTREEQQEIYGRPDPPESPHFLNPRCRAVDIRVRDFTEDEELAIITWLETHYRRDDEKKVAFIHGEGNNRHLHCQYPSRNGYDDSVHT